jgi:photosystem II stability/assembly factor-like uncharacterized protein
MGPPGGDVRALAADPLHPRVLYLGTTDGHIFGSTDAGDHWQILGRASIRLDGLVTSIIVDPRNSNTLFASSWTREPGREGGGVFRSDDSGHTWRVAGLLHRAVRALVQAPSNPDVLVAGTLDGVFCSRDFSVTWKQISPSGDLELANVDSVAIDPLHPDTIYAGTFHLPWKTTDGGRHWVPIHAGMIDDSDVLSFVVDQRRPRRVFVSACSGIYRSDNAGKLWEKVQGIPFSARRTYVLRQSSRHPSIVYAGTSEGLWQTRDGGESWRPITPHDWVINTMVVVPADDPSVPDRIVVGTEQLGILISDDGGRQFRAANDGFDHRQIISIALDRDRPGRVLAVLANAPEPIVATEDSGRTWLALGPGLRAEGMKGVYASPEGWWASLDSGGLMRYDAAKGAWLRAGVLSGEVAETPRTAKTSKITASRGKLIRPRRSEPFSLVVNDMAFARKTWFAATERGLLASRDHGATWTLFHFGPVDLPVNSVRVSPDGLDIRVVSLRGMVFSLDGGRSWSWHDLPPDSGGALRLDRAADGTILVSAVTGLYISRDAGQSWTKVGSGLPEVPLQDLALTEKVWLASVQTGGLYFSRDEGRSWFRVSGTLADGYFPVVTAAETGDTLYAASATDSLYAVQLPVLAATSAEKRP